MPGVFDGDESCKYTPPLSPTAQLIASTAIQASANTPAPHPHDRALLRPLNSIGKPKVTDTGSSFLRRTEYISNAPKARHDDIAPKPIVKRPRPTDRFTPLPRDMDKESPEYILKAVLRSFEFTAANLANPLRLRHPSKRNVKLVSSHPLIPDFEAMNDPGGYVSVKFQNNPVPPSSTYDVRLETGILRPLTGSDARNEAHAAALSLHERHPDRHLHPGPQQDYEFFLAETASDSGKFKRKCDVLDLDSRDNDELYTSTNSSGARCFRFKRVRAYETAQETQLQGEDRWNREVAIAVNDGSDGVHQKAAYVYPLLLRTTIRPQRSKNIDRLKWGGEEEEMVDFLDLSVREPDDGERRARRMWGEHPNGWEDAEEEEEPQGNGHGNGTQNEHDEDQDAEAESE
jgi:RNA polymerase II-associated factor 1